MCSSKGGKIKEKRKKAVCKRARARNIWAEDARERAREDEKWRAEGARDAAVADCLEIHSRGGGRIAPGVAKIIARWPGIISVVGACEDRVWVGWGSVSWFDRICSFDETMRPKLS